MMMIMRLRLLVRVRHCRVRCVELAPDERRQRFALGRLAESAICLTEPSISRRHAEFRFVQAGEAAGWWLEDLVSRNGVYLNGARIRAAVRLRDGDRIELGSVRMLVQLGLSAPMQQQWCAEKTLATAGGVTPVGQAGVAAAMENGALSGDDGDLSKFNAPTAVPEDMLAALRANGAEKLGASERCNSPPSPQRQRRRIRGRWTCGCCR